MNQKDLGSRFKIAFFILGVAGMVLWPAVFFYAIFGVLAVVFSAATFIYLAGVFRSRANRELGWGVGDRFPMTRLSRLVVGALFGCVTAYFVIGMFFKTADTHYLTITFVALAILSVGSRWLDMRRVR